MLTFIRNLKEKMKLFSERKNESTMKFILFEMLFILKSSYLGHKKTTQTLLA